MTSKTIAKKILEFYKTHKWGRGSLYNGRHQTWCVLGAAAAVVTNEQLMKDLYDKYREGLSEPYELVAEDGSKNIDLVYQFADDFGTYLAQHSKTGREYFEHETLDQVVIAVNDTYKQKRSLIRQLENFIAAN